MNNTSESRGRRGPAGLPSLHKNSAASMCPPSSSREGCYLFLFPVLFLIEPNRKPRYPNLLISAISSIASLGWWENGLRKTPRGLLLMDKNGLSLLMDTKVLAFDGSMGSQFCSCKDDTLSMWIKQTNQSNQPIQSTMV